MGDKAVPIPVTYACSHCGSKNVSMHGDMEWSEAKQDWVCLNFNDDPGYCHDCWRETDVVELFVKDYEEWLKIKKLEAV